jgi:hypothetical protein
MQWHHLDCHQEGATHLTGRGMNDAPLMIFVLRFVTLPSLMLC